MRALATAGRIACVLSIASWGLAANAQDLPATTVLGLATEGADDAVVADNLTGVLRRAVQENRTVRHTGSESTLAQMSLAFGCEDQREITCLQQIGREVQSRYVISGSVSRTAPGEDWAYKVETWIFDVEAARELRTASAQFGRSQVDVDDLRDVARTLVARLLAPEVGSLEVRSEVDRAEVLVDGRPAGLIADGVLQVANVPVGQRHVEVRAEGYEIFETTSHVRADASTPIRARMVETGGDVREVRPRRTGGMGPLQWVGIGSLIAGAVLGVVAIAMAADVNATDNSAAWSEYRHRVTVFAPGSSSACDAIDRIPAGMTFNGTFGHHGGEWELGVDPDTGRTRVPASSGLTSQQLETLEDDAVAYPGQQGEMLDKSKIETVCTERTTQWIVGGLAVATGVVGTYLLFGTPSPPADDSTARIRLTPILTRTEQGLGLHVTF